MGKQQAQWGAPGSQQQSCSLPLSTIANLLCKASCHLREREWLPAAQQSALSRATAEHRAQTPPCHCCQLCTLPREGRAPLTGAAQQGQGMAEHEPAPALQPQGMPCQAPPVFTCHGRASNPAYIPVSTASCHNFQQSPWSLTVCPCYPTGFLLLHTPMHFLSLPLIFFTLHSSKQQYWSYYLQKLINCWKTAASTNWAKFTFSLHSFFTQSFLTLTQIINRAGLKFYTQNWDFMENMHLITLNFARPPISSVIQFLSCHHQTDIIPPTFSSERKRSCTELQLHTFLGEDSAPCACLLGTSNPTSIHPSMWKVFSSLSPQLFASPPYWDTAIMDVHKSNLKCNKLH